MRGHRFVVVTFPRRAESRSFRGVKLRYKSSKMGCGISSMCSSGDLVREGNCENRGSDRSGQCKWSQLPALYVMASAFFDVSGFLFSRAGRLRFISSVVSLFPVRTKFC